VTTWAEFTEKNPQFKLCGGPFDGRKVQAKIYESWPSLIKMVRDGIASVSVYQMRIGDLERYDYVGEAAPEPPPHA